MKVTDEKLSAYIDGELPSDEMRALEEQFSDNPELVDRLTKLQKVDSVLAETLGEIAEAPLPEHILNLVKESADSQRNNVLPFKKRVQVSRFQFPLSIAAAALFGLILGGIFLPEPITEQDTAIYAGAVNIDSRLHRALETLPSQSNEGDFMPVVTFNATDGRMCREIQSSDSHALACRSNDIWTVLAVTYNAQNSLDASYSTASAETSIVFDFLAQELMQGAPLSANEERQLIQQNWQADRPTTEQK